MITTAANANDVTQPLALLHRFKRLAVRRERWVGVGLSGPCVMACPWCEACGMDMGRESRWGKDAMTVEIVFARVTAVVLAAAVFAVALTPALDCVRGRGGPLPGTAWTPPM